ncbi:hypothetical protein [Microbacterium enclense]|uniref:hypothetical protein n=1 Tax=Microbacterium enclense TaxID=993073 RepID=UPI00343A44A2
MSSPSFFARFPRSLAAAGATLALVAGGLLAPQAASAYHFVKTLPYIRCVDAAGPTLVAGGQAVKKTSGPQGPGYYLKGSNEFVGNQQSGGAVGEVTPGVWKRFSICQ